MLTPEQRATVEDTNYLNWAEERLKGAYELCTKCKGMGDDGFRLCPQCSAQGWTPRTQYLEAERRLSDAQRARIGQDDLLEKTEETAGIWQLDDG